MPRKITKEYEVFFFDELSEEAKNKAINDHINFLMEIISYEEGGENFRKAVDTAERMHTPWFTGEYIWDYCKDEILLDLKTVSSLSMLSREV